MIEAKYLIPGAFFPEEIIEFLDANDTNAAVHEAWAKAPKGSFCFTLHTYDVPTDEQRKVLEEMDGKFTPKGHQQGGRYYLGGLLFDAEAIEELEGDYAILLSNMRSNNWPWLIRCPTGNWQPWGDIDQLLPAKEYPDGQDID